MEKRKFVEKGSAASLHWPMAAQDEELFYDGIHIKWVPLAELPPELQGDEKAFQSLARNKVIEIRGDGFLREARFNPNPETWALKKKSVTREEEAALRQRVEEEERQIEKNEKFHHEFQSNMVDASWIPPEAKAVALMLSEIARRSRKDSVAIRCEPAGRPSTPCMLCGKMSPEPIWQRVSLNEFSRMVCATCAGGTILEREKAQTLGIRVGLKMIHGQDEKPTVARQAPLLSRHGRQNR